MRMTDKSARTMVADAAEGLGFIAAELDRARSEETRLAAENVRIGREWETAFDRLNAQLKYTQGLLDASTKLRTALAAENAELRRVLTDVLPFLSDCRCGDPKRCEKCALLRRRTDVLNAK